MQGVAAGEITPSEAGALSKLVDAHGNAIKLADLAERLARIEAARRTSAPTALRADHPIDDAAGDLRATGALVNWQRWVAQGKATVSMGALCLIGVELTAEARVARFGTEA